MRRPFQRYSVNVILLVLLIWLGLAGCDVSEQNSGNLDNADQRAQKIAKQQQRQAEKEARQQQRQAEKEQKQQQKQEQQDQEQQRQAQQAPEEAKPPAQPEMVVGDGVVWYADFETGDMSQWRANTTRGMAVESDSGQCSRPGNGVSTEQAHSGKYSMKMTIDSDRTAGCRQFRKPEASSGGDFYYGAWFYIPELTQVGVFWNILQFKAKDDGGESGVFWKLEIRNNEAGDMVVVPVWKSPIPGPHKDGNLDAELYYHTKATVPVGEWFHLEVFLRQSEEFDGQIIVWQDGIELLNLQNVRTRWPGGVQNWSVNNYGRGLQPNPTVLYIDDVTVSTQRVGP